ncbi:hypothetical protein Tco_1559299, partial [Tanacetum coccineum]
AQDQPFRSLERGERRGNQPFRSLERGERRVAMKSSLLGLVCFFSVILLAKVSGHPRWEVLEAMANRNVNILDHNMEAITGIDNDLSCGTV